jgi:hypothetical protein
MCSREVVCFQWGKNWILKFYLERNGRLCGLVVIVPGYRSRDPGSIPGDTRFCEKYWVWNGVHSASWVQLSSYLEEKVATSVKKIEITAVDPPRWLRDTLYPQKLALTSLTSSGRSVGIVRSRTKATELVRGSEYRLCGSVISNLSNISQHIHEKFLLGKRFYETLAIKPPHPTRAPCFMLWLHCKHAETCIFI